MPPESRQVIGSWVSERIRLRMKGEPTMETKLYIDGEFVVGAGEPEEILDPATGELIARILSASREQIDRAVGAASRALPKWASTTPGQRSGMLLKLADKIESAAEAFSRL